MGEKEVLLRKGVNKDHLISYKKWEKCTIISPTKNVPFKNSLDFKHCNSVHTGWPKSKFANSNSYYLYICIFDPMLVKPKCVWEASIYFHFSAVYLQFSAVCLQFSKINGGLQNTFWLYQHGVRNAYFQSYSHLK